jgi:hypothetical protein
VYGESTLKMQNRQYNQDVIMRMTQVIRKS